MPPAFNSSYVKQHQPLQTTSISWNVICWNVQILKCARVIMWKSCNVQVSKCANVKMCRCRNVQMLKCADVEMSKCRNVELSKCWNFKYLSGCRLLLTALHVHICLWMLFKFRNLYLQLFLFVLLLLHNPMSQGTIPHPPYYGPTLPPP